MRFYLSALCRKAINRVKNFNVITILDIRVTPINIAGMKLAPVFNKLSISSFSKKKITAPIMAEVIKSPAIKFIAFLLEPLTLILSHINIAVEKI